MIPSGARGAPLRLRDALAVPFALIRVPLRALDRQLAQRVDPRSGTRVVFDCALGTVDIVAGHLLGDTGITQYGTDRVQAAVHPHPRAITTAAVRELPSAIPAVEPVDAAASSSIGNVPFA